LEVIHGALDHGHTPEEVVFKIIVPAIEAMVKAISQNFDTSLAQHFISAKIATEVTEDMFSRLPTPPESIGTLVVGTAFGDLHSLGKRIVTGFLKPLCIKVVDIGVNVPGEKFVDEAVANNAKVIGISSMMLHTARGENGCVKVRKILKERGLERKIKIIVGGAPYRYDPALYLAVGADGWADDGVTASKEIIRLIGEAAR
jgi:trimethylamine corrinoid protein